MNAVHIPALQFFDFAARPGPTVILAQVSPLQRFNTALLHRLRPAHRSEVSCGYISLFELLVLGDAAIEYLMLGLQACEKWKLAHPLPGYYLFRAGEMLAWDSGLPARPDLQRIIGASFLGVLGYAFTGNWKLVAMAARTGAQEATGERIASRFHRLANEPRRERPTSQPPRNPAADLLEAYRLLGVLPHASNEEVEAAWRQKRAEMHPDRVAGDPAECARRTRISKELNRARDLIRAHRERGRWPAGNSATA